MSEGSQDWGFVKWPEFAADVNGSILSESSRGDTGCEEENMSSNKSIGGGVVLLKLVAGVKTAEVGDGLQPALSILTLDISSTTAIIGSDRHDITEYNIVSIDV